MVIFEGHTGERVETFSKQFADVLAEADGVALAPVFLPKGRTGASDSQTSDQLLVPIAAALDRRGVKLWTISSYDELPGLLRGRQPSFDVVIGFSAGILDRHLRNLPLEPK